MTDLAELSGIRERRIRSILNGHQANVAWTVADALVTHALGGPTLWLDELAAVYGVPA